MCALTTPAKLGPDLWYPFSCWVSKWCHMKMSYKIKLREWGVLSPPTPIQCFPKREGGGNSVTLEDHITSALGCAFQLVFRFIPVLIFRNSGFSTKFPDSGGTHVGIKSFQGKINLLRNSWARIPDPEFQREGPVTSATIPYHTRLTPMVSSDIFFILFYTNPM